MLEEPSAKATDRVTPAIAGACDGQTKAKEAGTEIESMSSTTESGNTDRTSGEAEDESHLCALGNMPPHGEPLRNCWERERDASLIHRIDALN